MGRMSGATGVLLAIVSCLGFAQSVWAENPRTEETKTLLERQGLAADKATREWIDSMKVGEQARLELLLAEKAKVEKEREEVLDFKGLGFGPGVGLLVYFGDDKPTEAEVVNGVVRITAEEQAQPVVMLESHFFFTKGEKPRYGLGPFVSVLSSTEQFLDALGFGVLGGGRRAGTSFNVGVGAVWNRNVQVLGDGIEANEPLPAGESEIRYKKKTTIGLQAITSFAF